MTATVTINTKGGAVTYSGEVECATIKPEVVEGEPRDGQSRTFDHGDRVRVVVDFVKPDVSAT